MLHLRRYSKTSIRSFFPELLCRAIRRLNFFGKSSTNFDFLSRTGWEWCFSPVNSSTQICFFENAADVVGVVSEVEVAVLTCT